MRQLLVQQIPFHEDVVEVADREGRHYVPVKRICDNIGLSWDGQRQFIQRDARLNSTACIIHVVGADKKLREMLCLPLNYLTLWLAKINPGRYSGDVRRRLMRYQEECAEVLYQHFSGASFPNPSHQGRGMQEDPSMGSGRTGDLAVLAMRLADVQAQLLEAQTMTIDAQTETIAILRASVRLDAAIQPTQEHESDPGWLTTVQVAQQEGVSASAVRRRIRRGRYPRQYIRLVPGIGRGGIHWELHHSVVQSQEEERKE